MIYNIITHVRLVGLLFQNIIFPARYVLSIPHLLVQFEASRSTLIYSD